MANKSRLPKSLPFIVGNEAAERFSFYGMKAILTTFLVAQFYNPYRNPALQTEAEARANEITHLFNTLVYFLPIAGAIIADWFWGKYKTIIYLSLVYCCGHLFLSVFENSYIGFLSGLLLIAIGAGGIKPCVTANVGDQLRGRDEQLISKAFSWFYFSINVGSFIAILLMPLIRYNASPAIAFGVPGILMAIATVIFFAGRKMYVRVPPSGINKENFFTINFYALRNAKRKKHGQSVLDVAKEKYNTASVDGVKAVWRILILFALVPVFWALNDQNSSEWVLQAQKMDLHFLGHTWLAEQIQSLNPILVLVYIPLFNYGLFPCIKKLGFNFTPYRKIGTGFILAVISFLVIYWIQLQIDKGLKPNIGWQFIGYFIITAAEVLIYQTGLEYAYAQAPPSMKSTIMSFWLLTISLGNYIVSAVNSSIAQGGILKKLEGASFFLFFTLLMGITCIVYFILLKTVLRNPVKIKKTNTNEFIQEEIPASPNQ